MKGKSGSRSLIALCVLSLIGVGMSIYLSSHFYKARSGTGGFHSICNLGSSFNCDAVAASSYSELFGGIPLSSFAAGWLLATAIVSILAMGETWRREGSRILLAMTGLSTLFSVVYLYVMAAVLGTYCLFCLGVDAVNVLSLGIAFLLWRSEKKPSALDLGPWKITAAVAAGTILISLAVLKEMESQTVTPGDIQDKANSVLQGQPVAVGAGPELPSLGPANAPVTIVEFSDFQCPHCRVGAMLLHTLQSRYPTQIRVVLRNFPLDPACNRLVQHNMHPVACQAAKVAFCANKQSKFAPVYESMFEKQETLVTTKPLEVAANEGVDTAKLNACVASEEASAAVTRDIEEGLRLNVKATPTFFINGLKVEGPMPARAWNLVVDALLNARR